MKRIILFLLFAVTTTFAQTSQTLQTDVKKLYVAANDIDLETLSEMLCTTDKAGIYEKLDSHFQTDQKKFRFVFTNAKFNYSDIRILNGDSHCGITFRNVVRITYFNPINVGEVEKSLKDQFNAQSIVYDKSRNAFLIVYNAKMIARADAVSKHWVFAFTDNTFPAEIFGGCFDENLKKELGL